MLWFHEGWHEIVKHRNASKYECHMGDHVERTGLYFLKVPVQSIMNLPSLNREYKLKQHLQSFTNYLHFFKMIWSPWQP
jgi:hypothetical protein